MSKETSLIVNVVLLQFIQASSIHSQIMRCLRMTSAVRFYLQGGARRDRLERYQVPHQTRGEQTLNKPPGAPRG